MHIHVRNPQMTRPSMDLGLYREAVQRIRNSRADVLIHLTTGPGARFVPGADNPLQPGRAARSLHKRVSIPTQADSMFAPFAREWNNCVAQSYLYQRLVPRPLE